MLRRNLVLGLTVVLLAAPGIAHGSGTEGGQCTQLLNTVCNQCHSTDRVCDAMGNPEMKWESILDWMISNGAELKKAERDLLVNCLNEPFYETQKACGK